MTPPPRNLLLVLAGALLGALLFGATLSVAQDAPPAPAAERCTQWEVTQWSPKEDGDCKWKGSSPYSHRDEWCQAPQGAEVIDALSVGETGDMFRFWVKRCVAR